MGNPVKMDDKNGGTPMTQETPKSWEVVFGMVKVWMVSIWGFPARHGGSPSSLDGFCEREDPIVRNG